MSEPTSRPPIRRNIALLARIQLSDGAGAATPARKYFVNILELGTRGLILEADRPLPAGAPLTLTVAFPGHTLAQGQDPFSRLECRVRKPNDEQKLHYDLSILDMDDRSRERLHGYLRRGAAIEAA